MCGRYAWVQKNSFQKPEISPISPPPHSVSYNRAPGQVHPIIIQNGKNYKWSTASWGIISDQKLAQSTPVPINARIETISEKLIFQNSIRHRRCLVPADGYFEWQKNETQKYPHFHFLDDRNSFAMAGIWNSSIQNGKRIHSFAILTHPASSNILHIHHRMPVILKPEDWTAWLAQETQINQLLNYYAQSQQKIEAYQVSSRVNNIQQDGPELIEKFTEKQSTLW
jgi:putative SOS response-associated peptidase YedK